MFALLVDITLRKALFTKFDITKKEFEAFMKLPNKSYYDYPSYETHPIYRSLGNVYKKVNPQT